jgi:hypothetical protein
LSHLTTPQGDKVKLCGFTEPRKATSDIIRIEGSHVPLTRLKPIPPARDPESVQPDTWPRPWGYKVRLYIEAEEELQQLGGGWRTVIVKLDGKQVHLHHNTRIATKRRSEMPSRRSSLATNAIARKPSRLCGW